jgi:hypothetical protein
MDDLMVERFQSRPNSEPLPVVYLFLEVSTAAGRMLLLV